MGDMNSSAGPPDKVVSHILSAEEDVNLRGWPEAGVTLTDGTVGSLAVGLLLLGGLSGMSMASTDKFNSPNIL